MAVSSLKQNHFNFVSGFCSRVTEGNHFHISQFGLMKQPFNLNILPINTAVCTGPQKNQTQWKKQLIY
jgi:hypothetical protein